MGRTVLPSAGISKGAPSALADGRTTGQRRPDSGECVINILIADDHASLRRGLKEILMGELEGTIFHEASRAQHVLDQIQTHACDLLILDIARRGRSGLDLLRDLQQLRPELPVLVLSMHPENQYAKRVLRAGAAGYMNKETARKELVKAVRKVLAGG